ncbi:flagellar motor stator protein MotA, partial [Rhizobium sp. KAs_5_22]
MNAILGLVVMLGCVFGGYVLAGGKFDIIMHALPHEIRRIGGAARRTFIM